MIEPIDLPAGAPTPPRRVPEPIEHVDLLSVITLVLWLAAVAIGLIGLLLPSGVAAPPPASQPAAPPTQVLNVMLEQPAPPEPAPPQQASQPPTPATPQQTPASGAPPAMPALAAAPSPAIAFAIPVSGPTQLSDAAPAGLTRDIPLHALPPVHRLVYGQGEGRQPAPQYPAEAVADQQQGVVVVRFLVDPNGEVRSAQAISPCPWPLLNDAAVGAVRDTWRFPPGTLRSYEVSIRFQLREL